MLGPVALAVLAAAAPMKLAAPGLSQVNVDAKAADLFLDYFAQQVSSYGIRVTTKNEIATLLGFERQRQLLGCTDESASCMAELGGALGVDGIITGSVGKVGTGFVLTLKVVHTGDGVPLGSYSGRLASEDEVLDWLAQTAHRFALDNKQTTAAAPAPRSAVSGGVTTTTKSTGIVRKLSWLPAGVGLVGLVGGLVLMLDASAAGNRLSTDASYDVRNIDETISELQGRQNAGFIFATAGVLALVAGVLMFALGGRSE